MSRRTSATEKLFCGENRRGLILFQKATDDENIWRGLGHMIKAIERRYGLEVQDA